MKLFDHLQRPIRDIRYGTGMILRAPVQMDGPQAASKLAFELYLEPSVALDVVREVISVRPG